MLVIVTLYVKSFVCVPSLSSQLLLRIFPNFFDYFGSSPMCLSSPNRSNSKAFRHIMPYSAPLCKGMIYSKTGLPWQMNNTRIIYFLLLTYLGLSRFFLIFRAFAHFFSLSTIFPFLGFFRLISVCLFHQMV